MKRKGLPTEAGLVVLISEERQQWSRVNSFAADRLARLNSKDQF
jgi:hypothetical protein